MFFLFYIDQNGLKNYGLVSLYYICKLSIILNCPILMRSRVVLTYILVTDLRGVIYASVFVLGLSPFRLFHD